MMTYPDGSEILIGDAVLFEKGQSSGTIVAVISEELADWNVEEPGVMIKSAPSGLVFIPTSMFSRARVSLEQRGKSGFRWNGPLAK
jgi:hypothetical protein